MKRVITLEDGKRRVLNTETAKLLAEWSNGVGPGDFYHCHEDMYLTKAGAYFLHGQGGPYSKYGTSSPDGNNLYGGQKLVPLTIEEAMDWAEKRLDGEQYCEIFGEPEEAGDDKEPITLTIKASTKATLYRMREETGKSISQIIEETFAE